MQNLGKAFVASPDSFVRGCNGQVEDGVVIWLEF